MKKLFSILLIAILAFGEVSGLMLASPPQPAMAMGVETDVFESSWGSIKFLMPDSSIEVVELSGTSTMQVFF